MNRKVSKEFDKPLLLPPADVEDKEEPFLERRLSKDEVEAKVKEMEKLKKEKQVEEEKFFSQSQTKLMGLLSDIKLTVFFAVIFSGLNGGVWPFYGL